MRPRTVARVLALVALVALAASSGSCTNYGIGLGVASPHSGYGTWEPTATIVGGPVID